MKKAPKTHHIGEERLRESADIFKRLFESAPKPKVNATETVVNTVATVASEVTTEVSTAIGMLFGVELKAGSEHKISQSSEQKQPQKKEKSEKVMTAEHMEYYREYLRASEGKETSTENVAIKNQLDAILYELKNLKNSSDELENVFKDVALDAPPEKPGIYHLTFFEGFLKLVIKMKDKVQDGVVYAKLFRSRKQEKSYHAMNKKHGTSFSMHHDRSVATQTG